MFVVRNERIKENPWQTRTRYDDEYVRELAVDIAQRYEARPRTRGLLQIPAGRIVDGDGQAVVEKGFSLRAGDLTEYLKERGLYVELAFGHNRWRAFRMLAGQVEGVVPIEFEVSLEEARRWAALPVEYAAWSDEEMATAAWTENYQRRDLSALEEACAIRRAKETFGWTHAELGERWGMAVSTISNKLRLLGLPDELREPLEAGEISERQAMALAPVTALPEPARERIKGTVWWDPEKMIGRARGGRASGMLRTDANQAIRQATVGLRNAPYLDHAFDEEKEEIRAAVCDECAERVAWEDESRCPDRGCRRAKQKAWRALRVELASEAVGLSAIRVKEGGGFGWIDDFSKSRPRRRIGRALYEEGECEKLRLQWAGESWMGGVKLAEEGFPDVRVVCDQGGGECACLEERLAQEGIKSAAVRGQERTEGKRAVARLMDEAAEELAGALRINERGAWLAVLRGLGCKLACEDWDLERLRRAVARRAIRRSNRVSWGGSNADLVTDELDEMFEGLGLRGLSTERDVALYLDQVEGWIDEAVEEAVEEAVGRISPDVLKFWRGELGNCARRVDGRDGDVAQRIQALRERVDGLDWEGGWYDDGDE